MKLTDDALEIANKRYFKDDEKSWDELAIRVGGTEPYTTMIADGLFMPGGRILRNVGRSRGSLFNCYHIPIGDSREEIGECFKTALILWGEGGGIGINFSSLRPKGASIAGVGGKSSGAVSFMQALDGIAATIESGGQRRAASLGLLEVWHPEIFSFIRSKNVDKQISYFNISVGVNHPFLEAVQQDKDWNLTWRNQVWDTVPARKIWDAILEGMMANGEPGLLNMSRVRINNSWYFAPIQGTNPCGEACLEENGVCNLGSLILPSFIDSAGRVKWSKMEEVIHGSIRFLDNCIDINKYSLWSIQQTAQRGRRIGLGIMGLSDALFKCGIRYGSREAIDFIERLFKFIRNISYEASVKLAVDKGTFPAYDAFNYCKSKFIRTLPPSLRGDIRKHGIRNVTVNAVAPTGTISLVAGTTSSIEPLAYKAYRREDQIGIRNYIHPIYRDFLAADFADPDWFVDSTGITPEEHVETQVAIQKFVDGAVSKTILVPNDYNNDELSSLLLESIFDLKGITIYREGTREGQPLTPLTEEEARECLNDSTDCADLETVNCARGICEL